MMYYLDPLGLIMICGLIALAVVAAVKICMDVWRKRK